MRPVGPSKITPKGRNRQSAGDGEATTSGGPSPQRPKVTEQAGPVINIKYSTDMRQAVQHEAEKLRDEAKRQLDSLGNLKKDVKGAVNDILDRLCTIVKRSQTALQVTEGKLKVQYEEEIVCQKKRMNERVEELVNERMKAGRTDSSTIHIHTQTDKQKTAEHYTQKGPIGVNDGNGQNLIIKHMEEHTKLLTESNRKIDELKEKLDWQTQLINTRTYASVTADKPVTQTLRSSVLHTVVVTSQDEGDTGEQVLTKVREAVDAKEGWVKVERVRKGKDRKVIMSCGSVEDRRKVKERIEKAGKHLIVEEVKNKDPLLMLRDVLSMNTDEDVLKAFRNQNKDVLKDLREEDLKMEVKYRRRARNPHTTHMVLSVSPAIWRRATEAGTIHIDLQRIRVSDQSPLVQCSRCLGYGHSKRFCKDPADLCSHCGGLHLNADCPERKIGADPVCRNCEITGQDRTDHNAFSQECPVRKRWDSIARMSVAYC